MKKNAVFLFLALLFMSMFSYGARAEGGKYIALTFDDGPHPVYTKKVLAVLERKQVKATFFVVGFRAELNHNELLHMKKIGCEIGNHTYSHCDLFKVTATKAANEISATNDIVRSVTGNSPVLFRPPFGRSGAVLPEHGGMTQVLWDVDSLDWRSHTGKAVVEKILHDAGDCDIILMHDFFESTADAVEPLIDALAERGYQFVTVSEILKIRELRSAAWAE